MPQPTKFLSELGQQMREQDNCATSHPIFVVQQLRRTYGFDPIYTDEFVWVSADECVEADAETSQALEAEHDATGKERDGWTRTAYRDKWVFVTACLTRAGAEHYIARQRHNLSEPRVYVESGYRNDEWIELRKALMAMATVNA